MLILSARSDLPIKLQGFELGAVDYVAKPFSLDELLARARVQLRRARGADDGTMIRVGSLVLDLARRQARVGDTVADLSDREFRLLHFLMQHVGQVVSRERLLQRCGGTTSIRDRTSSTCASGGCGGGWVPRRRSRRCAMRAIARASCREIAAAGCRLRDCTAVPRRAAVGRRSRSRNYAAMVVWPRWETIPFHLVWISLTLALRLPGLAAARDADRARGRRDAGTRSSIGSTPSGASSSGVSCSRFR